MVDSLLFRKVLGCYPTGVCVVTSVAAGGIPVGMSIGSFTSVSLAPPLVAFFPKRQSGTWARIGETGRFCVNVLADHQEAISRCFADPEADKFAGVAHRLSAGGLPILDGVVAWIDCAVHAVHGAGDHLIVVGEVEAMAEERPVRPLLFHRGGYRRLDATPLAA